MDAATRQKWLERARQAEAGRKAERAARAAVSLEDRVGRLETALAGALERIAALEAGPGMFISPASDEAAIMNIAPEPPTAPPAPAPRPTPTKPRPPAPARVEPERELVAAPAPEEPAPPAALPARGTPGWWTARLKAADPLRKLGHVSSKDRAKPGGFTPEEQAAIEAALAAGKVTRGQSPQSFCVAHSAWRGDFSRPVRIG